MSPAQNYSGIGIERNCVSDSYFTEKYLGEPSKQPQAYDSADLTMRAGNLYNKQYLLIHGTADTVVIAQHSMMFAKALIEQDVLFQQLVIIYFSAQLINL